MLPDMVATAVIVQGPPWFCAGEEIASLDLFPTKPVTRGC
jgi:hypothetical protein